jgi:hypothetical protein
MWMVRLHKLQRSMTIGSLTNDVQGWHISQCSSDTKPHERVVINNQYLCEFTHTATSQDSACMLLRFATPFHLDFHENSHQSARMSYFHAWWCATAHVNSVGKNDH